MTPPAATRPSHPRKPVVLCILDGWGYRPESEDNAIAQAHLPHWDALMRKWPHALLKTSGDDVGLPDGQMGNSEVGHMNIGAGRVVMQELPRIDKAIADGSLAGNPALIDLIAKVKATGGRAHLLGLLSPGGVHSHQRHIAALANVIAEAGVPVVVHAFLDGRDTPPSSAQGFVRDFLAGVKGHDVRLGTVGGRFYAMDRDKRWDRVQAAYKAIVAAEGAHADDAAKAIQAGYDGGKTDEFIPPTVIGDYAGMKDGDGLAMVNFRSDRAREILAALVDPGFSGFERGRVPHFSAQIGMSEYSAELETFLKTLFPANDLAHILGEVVAEAGIKQFRIAETEKYAHVTFFFNGGREQPFEGEDRVIVPSPKVATYDLQPEMSAAAVTDKLVEAIGSGKYGLVIVNFANGDMVGHSGRLDAAIAAVQAVDGCLGRVTEAVEKAGGTILITADHGNVEMMRDPETGEPHTAHTTGPVPVILAGAPEWVQGIDDGRLADIAPTLLALLGLPQPKEMTGHSLLVPEASARRAAG